MYKYGKGKKSGTATMKYVCETIFQTGKCVSGCIGRFLKASKMCTCKSLVMARCLFFVGFKLCGKFARLLWIIEVR